MTRIAHLNQEPIIEARDVSRHDPVSDRTLLFSANLKLFPGDRLGLIGPSGCGKSTFLRAMALLDPVQNGEILHHGQPIPPEAIPHYRQEILYLPQRPTMYPGTVRDNLAKPFLFAAATNDFDEEKALGFLDLLNRDKVFLEQNAKHLSGGEQQVVAFVRGLLLNPRTLLLDEPTASLDSISTQRFETVLENWQDPVHNNAGQPTDHLKRSLIFAGHDHAQVQRLTDHVIEIIDGTLDLERPH